MRHAGRVNVSLKYKRNYIDEERGSKEAAEIAFQVIKDRLSQQKITY